MSPVPCTVTLQRVVPDAVLEARPDRVLAACQKALVRKARIEGYTGVDLDQVTVTYRRATGSARDEREPSTVIRLDAPTVGDRTK